MAENPLSMESGTTPGAIIPSEPPINSDTVQSGRKPSRRIHTGHSVKKNRETTHIIQDDKKAKCWNYEVVPPPYSRDTLWKMSNLYVTFGTYAIMTLIGLGIYIPIYISWQSTFVITPCIITNMTFIPFDNCTPDRSTSCGKNCVDSGDTAIKCPTNVWYISFNNTDNLENKIQMCDNMQLHRGSGDHCYKIFYRADSDTYQEAETAFLKTKTIGDSFECMYKEGEIGFLATYGPVIELYKKLAWIFFGISIPTTFLCWYLCGRAECCRCVKKK
jgi:hypothetical protein